jgi:pimeloyl-ACP methyl ester carboxylesterase
VSRPAGAGVLTALTLLLSACAPAEGAPGAVATGSGPAAPAPVPGTAPGVLLASGVHSLEVAGEPAVVLVPEHPNGRLVLYAHGYGADLAALLDDEAFGGLATGLVAAGYAVAASEARGDAWGSAASVEAHAALAATARQLTGAGEVFLVAESMGGLAAAQLVTGDRIEGLRAYAGIAPLCDLGSASGDFRESIEAAHGDGVGEALDRLSPVRLEARVPVRLWASGEDTVVVRDRNADACADQVRADGGTAEVVAARGEHGDPSHYDLDGVLAFFAAAAPG